MQRFHYENTSLSQGHLSGDEGGVDEKTSTNSRRASRSPRSHSDNDAERRVLHAHGWYYQRSLQPPQQRAPTVAHDNRVYIQRWYRGQHRQHLVNGSIGLVSSHKNTLVAEVVASSVAAVQQATGVALRSVPRTTGSSSERSDRASYTASTGQCSKVLVEMPHNVQAIWERTRHRAICRRVRMSLR